MISKFMCNTPFRGIRASQEGRAEIRATTSQRGSKPPDGQIPKCRFPEDFGTGHSTSGVSPVCYEMNPSSSSSKKWESRQVDGIRNGLVLKHRQIVYLGKLTVAHPRSIKTIQNAEKRRNNRLPPYESCDFT